MSKAAEIVDRLLETIDPDQVRNKIRAMMKRGMSYEKARDWAMASTDPALGSCKKCGKTTLSSELCGQCEHDQAITANANKKCARCRQHAPFPGSRFCKPCEYDLAHHNQERFVDPENPE